MFVSKWKKIIKNKFIILPYEISEFFYCRFPSFLVIVPKATNKYEYKDEPFYINAFRQNYKHSIQALKNQKYEEKKH